MWWILSEDDPKNISVKFGGDGQGVSEKKMFADFPNFKHLVAMTTIIIHVNKLKGP